MEAVREALQAGTDDEVNASFERPNAACGIRIHTMLRNDNDEHAYEQNPEKDSLNNVGYERAAHAAFAAISDSYERHQ